jgi:hypothetical protein
MLHKNNKQFIRLKNDSKSREAWRVNGILKKYYVRCGKDNCRCKTQRKLHGAYWYLIYRDGSRLIKRYVKRKDLDVVRASLKRGHKWRQQFNDERKRLLSGARMVKFLCDKETKGYTLPDFITDDFKIHCVDCLYKVVVNMQKLVKVRGWYLKDKDHNSGTSYLFWLLDRLN